MSQPDTNVVKEYLLSLQKSICEGLANEDGKADFIIDEEGMVLVAYYAKDEGDHLDIDKIKQYLTK